MLEEMDILFGVEIQDMVEYVNSGHCHDKSHGKSTLWWAMHSKCGNIS